MKEHRNTEYLHQMDSGEETECRVPTLLPNIPSVQEQEQKNRESALTAAGEKAENWLFFKNMNIFHWTQHK